MEVGKEPVVGRVTSTSRGFRGIHFRQSQQMIDLTYLGLPPLFAESISVFLGPFTLRYRACVVIGCDFAIRQLTSPPCRLSSVITPESGAINIE